MKKVKDNAYWRKRSVTLAKKIVRHQAKQTCAYCKASNRQTHGSHIFSEGIHENMSADLDNILCLCWLCHMGGLYNVRTDKRFSWHGTPAESITWFQRKYPQRWERLKDRTNSHYKVNFEDRFKKLNAMLKELSSS